MRPSGVFDSLKEHLPGILVGPFVPQPPISSTESKLREVDILDLLKPKVRFEFENIIKLV
jgi:hypothetical protein